MNYADTYISNTGKLLKHTDRLDEVNTRGVIRPITIDLNLTGYCNGGCNFCTQKNIERVNMPLESAKKVLSMYKVAGAEGLELTGGGEPLMYPYINEVIKYAKAYNYEVGIITNGMLMNKLTQKSIDLLSWLRVSLNPIYHKKLEIPRVKMKYGVYGANFVWEKGMNEDTFKWLINILNEDIFEYIKITPNVLLDDSLIKEYTNNLESLISREGKKNIFVGSRALIKSTDIPTNCYIGLLKPHINQDGKIYRCTCGTLDKGCYTKELLIGDLNDKDFKVPIEPDDFNTSICKICHYGDINNLIKLLLTDQKHAEFI